MDDRLWLYVAAATGVSFRCVVLLVAQDVAKLKRDLSVPHEVFLDACMEVRVQGLGTDDRSGPNLSFHLVIHSMVC